MDHIELFELTSDYDNYIQSEDALLPNISLILETAKLYYNPVIIKNYLRFVAVEDSSILLSGINMETENPEQTKDGFTLIGSYKNLFIDDPELLPYLYVMSGGKLMNYTTSLSIVPFRAYFKGIKYDDWVNGNT